MSPQTLADRFVYYADVVVAFAVVNSFAFVAALAEPDVRIAVSGQFIFFGGVLFFALLETAALFGLRRAELRLRAKDQDSNQTITGDYLRYMQIVRYFLIWFSAVIVIFLGIVAAK